MNSLLKNKPKPQQHNFLRKGQMLHKNVIRDVSELQSDICKVQQQDSVVGFSQQPRDTGTAFRGGIQIPVLPHLVSMVPGITLPLPGYCLYWLTIFVPIQYLYIQFTKFSVCPQKGLQLSLQLLYQCLTRGLLPEATPLKHLYNIIALPFWHSRITLLTVVFIHGSDMFTPLGPLLLSMQLFLGWH